MKNNLKDKIEYCGLNYKTEIKKIVAINIALILCGIALYFYQRNIQIVIIFVLADLIINFFVLTSYSDKARALDDERDDEFVTIISYFEVFITNKNNVYQSFNKVIAYCSEWMKEVVSNLLKEIDEDKTVQPFVRFSNNFSMKIATNIMLSIYSMVDQGESNDQINQFQILFEQLFKSKQQENLDKKKRNLSSLASLPLIGAGGVTIALTISIVSIIGDLINVI